jgi:hypothetical protein
MKGILHQHNEIVIYQSNKVVTCCGVVAIVWWKLVLILLLLSLVSSFAMSLLLASWYSNVDQSACASTSWLVLNVVFHGGQNPPPLSLPSPPPLSPPWSPPSSPPLSPPPCCPCFEPKDDRCQSVITRSCQDDYEAHCEFVNYCEPGQAQSVDVYVNSSYCGLDGTSESVCSTYCQGELHCVMSKHGCMHWCCIPDQNFSSTYPYLSSAWTPNCRRS